MVKPLLFSLIGYLCGSILFANLFSKVFRKENILEQSKDHNPGAANAYHYGGFWCGTCTLCGDLLKGFIPIFLFTLFIPIHEMNIKYAIVLASPVIGHAFPIFNRLKGGKGIAVTFGCLLGLLPYALPVLLFASVFIFFSVLIKISPHFYRTIFAYIATLIFLGLMKTEIVICVGFFIITLIVCLRLHLSKEEREKLKVRFAWMH